MKLTRIKVGTVSEFQVGSFKLCTIKGREVGVFRLASGEFRAVRNHCPHKGAPVCRGQVSGTWLPSAPGEMKYGMKGQVLVCPWHGYEFDLNDGKEVFQKDAMRLSMLAVSVEENKVMVMI